MWFEKTRKYSRQFQRLITFVSTRDCMKHVLTTLNMKYLKLWSGKLTSSHEIKILSLMILWGTFFMENTERNILSNF